MAWPLTALACPRLGTVENKKCPQLSFSTPARALERAGVSVEEVAHEAPCPSRVLGWLLGRERGCCDTKETTPRRSCVCGPKAQGPKGCFTTNSNLANTNIPCCASTLSSAFFCSQDLRPRQGPALECHLCARPRARPRASSPDGLTHAVTSVVAYEWNHGGQSASQSDSLTTSIDTMPCCWNRLSVCSSPRINEARCCLFRLRAVETLVPIIIMGV